MRYKNFKKLCAVFLAVGVLLTGFNFTVAAQADEEFDYVLYNGSASYYKNGEKCFFDDKNTGYALPVEKGTIMIPATMLCDWLDLDIAWNGTTETVTLNNTETIVSLRLREDKITVNGVDKALESVALFMGDKTFVPFDEVINKFGYNVISYDGLVIADKTLVPDEAAAEELKELFEEVIYKDSFEIPVKASTTMADETTGAEGWTYRDWGASGDDARIYAGITEDEQTDGKYSMYFEAVPSSFAGFMTNNIPLNREKPAHIITCKVKASEDYKSNKACIRIMFYQDATFLTSTVRGYADVVPGEWVDYHIILHDEYYTAGANAVRLLVSTTYAADERNNPPSGKVYFDDVKMSVYNPFKNSVCANMQPDVYGSWYELGQTVVFKGDNTALDAVKTVKGTIFNSYDEIIDVVTLSADSVKKSGWKWTPKEQGFYYVDFAGIRVDGTSIPLVNRFVESDPTKKLEWTYDLSARTIVVTDGTKPLDERSEKLYFSNKLMDDRGLRLANLVGFSGVRIHCIPWGPDWGNTARQVEPEKGVYNWELTDQMMRWIEPFGYNIIGNVLFTPQWASNRPDLTAPNSMGMPLYTTYAPADPEYLATFMQKLVERYGDKINIWEIYNEPHVPGSSVFWNDTPENYAEMLKSSYTRIKEHQPESIVTIGGIGARRYKPFIREFLKTDAFNYFDMWAMHGYEVDPWNYNDMAENVGFEKKDYMTTEGHMMLMNTLADMSAHTERMLSFRLMKEYFREWKYGSKLTTLFEMLNNTERETVGTTGSHCSGLFRDRPVDEPRMAASVLHTFFEIMENDLEYKGEFLLSGDQQAVHMKNGGKDMVVLWTETDGEFEIDPQILASYTADTKIVDWEGREISVSQKTLRGNAMYYISALNGAKIAEIKVTPDEVIYIANDKLRAQQLAAPVEETNLNKNRIFDPATFAVAEGVQWTESGWVWTDYEGTRSDEFDAKLAVSMDESGLYLMVDVTDNVYHQTTTVPKYLWAYDSLEFAFDTMGESIYSDAIECKVGLIDGKPVIYKQVAPYIGGNLPEGWSPADSVLDSKYVKIEPTDHGMLYKIFVPMSELYPFAYTGSEEHIRMTVLVNDNDNDCRRGWLAWAVGLANPKDAVGYGKLHFNR